MKTISTIEQLTPKALWGIADKYKLSYVWRYVSEKTDKKPTDVWEISASVKNIDGLWGETIRFVIPEGMAPEELTRMLKANDFEVVSIVPAYLWGGTRLLYRDIKDLPLLKLV